MGVGLFIAPESHCSRNLPVLDSWAFCRHEWSGGHLWPRVLFDVCQSFSAWKPPLWLFHKMWSAAGWFQRASPDIGLV